MSIHSKFNGTDALDFFLRTTIREGSLTVVLGDQTKTYGNGQGPSATVAINNTNLWKLAADPEMQVAEAYMDGRLTIEKGTLGDFLEITNINGQALYNSPSFRLLNLGVQKLLHINDVATSISNVAHHYDLSNDFYRSWAGDLDRFLYSCAYWQPGDTLADAQQHKMDHIARKLMLEPGQRVLDIGCGWGGLGLELASRYGVKVTGVTLSREQLANATSIAARNPGLALDFRFKDYRHLRAEVLAGEVAPFDRVVSVGMLEHVGKNELGTYFASVRDFLTPEGVALIHTIGRPDLPSWGDTGVTRFMNKHIFPGTYIPAMAQVTGAAQRAGLCVGDYEVLVGRHYANTLKAWGESFEANIGQVRKHLTSLEGDAEKAERTIRMFRLYLTGVEQAFRRGVYEVHHAQIFRDPKHVPDSRGYMYDSNERPRGVPGSGPKLIAAAA